MAAAYSASDGGMVGYRIPMARPRWTFILLGVNVAVFLAMTLFGALNGLGLNGSQDTRVLLIFGAMQNQMIAAGEFHRLLTSMFLHIGLIHLLFNSYALYVVGQDVERLYGSARFLVIYFLAGLGGSLASFVLGTGAISAGASGAIFGLFGASIAYFSLHRKTFGAARPGSVAQPADAGRRQPLPGLHHSGHQQPGSHGRAGLRRAARLDSGPQIPGALGLQAIDRRRIHPGGQHYHRPPPAYAAGCYCDSGLAGAGGNHALGAIGVHVR
ncbi:MAG: rhomboid family intramembrane serine protease [Anaerolineae bacterium]